VLLFLSYADADSDIAREVARRLSKENISVYSPQDDGGPAGLTSPDPDVAIQQADAFLALLSPDFLTSASCRMERGLALSRERARRGDGGTEKFVEVLKIRELPYLHARALQSRTWFDLTPEGAWDRVLNDLASAFESSSGAQPPANSPPAGGNGGQPRVPSPYFRNREREVSDIYGGITDQDGEHFWVVIAPPKLGKSWLLDQIGDKVYRSNPFRWMVKLVDVRDLAAEIADDADAIVRLMFGLDPQPGTGTPAASTIAADMIRNRRFHLCLLDSAELLEDATVAALRQHLAEINQRLSRAGGATRLALVAASRRVSEWTGISPAPRLQVCRLSEFKVEVIGEALQHLAEEMSVPLGPGDLEQIGKQVHELSEGLPALMAACLGWIREHAWNDLELLGDPAICEEIARPYIERDLLSAGSLSARGAVPDEDQRAAIEDALLLLSPYRFLTMSHLSRHIGTGTLQDQLGRIGWRSTDLWNAVSGADLLYLPLWQPWHEVYAPIRRLLCRHAYPAPAERSQAHHDGCEFMQSYMMGLYGSDQCRALVECLWQHVQCAALAGSADLDTALIELASRLSARLAPVPEIGVPDLRETAARFVREDEELALALAERPGLLDRVVQAVRQPT
jgi:TIR domain